MTYDCPLQSLIYFHVQFRVSSPFRKLGGRSLFACIIKAICYPAALRTARFGVATTTSQRASRSRTQGGKQRKGALRTADVQEGKREKRTQTCRGGSGSVKKEN